MPAMAVSWLALRVPSSGTRLPSARRGIAAPGARATHRTHAMPSRRCPCAAPGRRAGGQGSRSGPAGSSQPLPTPRSSNTQISMSRASARCCRPSSQTMTLRARVRGQQCARRHRCGAAPRTPARRSCARPAAARRRPRRRGCRRSTSRQSDGAAAVAARDHAGGEAARAQVLDQRHHHRRLAGAAGDHVADDDHRHGGAAGPRPALRDRRPAPHGAPPGRRRATAARAAQASDAAPAAMRAAALLPMVSGTRPAPRTGWRR